MKFRLLGPLEVWSDGSWQEVSAAKWRSLLSCLLIRAGQIVSTDSLIFELWGDNPPARANNLVSIYVHRLRKLIGDNEGRVLAYRAPGYLLRVSADDTDMQQFEALVADGRGMLDDGDVEAAAARLGKALALWRGPLLADVPPSELVIRESERVAELRLTATELWIQANLACGRFVQVIPELRHLVAENPLREGLWLQLMRALEGAGRQAEALEAYGQAREAISEELGVDPGAELQRLYVELLAADASGAGRPAPLRVSAETPSAITPERTRRPGEAPGEEPGREEPGVGEPDGEEAHEEIGEAPAGEVQGTIALSTVAGSREGAPGSSAPAESAGSPVTSPAQLPADIGDFTGRDPHVRHLCDMLTSDVDSANPGAVRVAVVAGAGGLGKTTLAVHAAHQVRAFFPDGQLYVDLLGASRQPAAPGEVLARFLRDLGIQGEKIPVSDEERAALYRTRLTGRRVLILLDNAKDAAQVRPLLPGSASCAVLVTTRNRTPDLARTRFVDLNVLADDEALVLFSRIVGDDRPQAEPDATAEVLLACAGLPLAIRICAARLAARSHWKIATMASRLRDERRRLDELHVGDLEVRASFQVSYDSLRPDRHGIDPARAFRLLGLWQGPTISLPAAAALLGEPEDDVADVLETLVDVNLLESPAPDQYRLHGPLRVYATERAEAELAAQERAAAISRLHDWCDHERADTDADQRETRASPPDGTAALVQTKAPDRLEALPTRSGMLTQAGAEATSVTSLPARNPDGDLDAARPSDRGRPICQEQPEALVNGDEGEPDSESRAGEPTAEKTTTGSRPVSRTGGDGFTGESEPRAAGEAFLAVLRAILMAQGITEREQVAAFSDALLQSWPETSGNVPHTPGETHREPRRPAGPAPVPTIPDASGYELRPDPLTARTPAEFVGALARLRQWAGNPPFREMAQRCGRQASPAAICTALGSDKLPSQRIVLAIVAACGGDEEQKRAFNTAWRKLEMTQEPRQRRGKRPANRKLYPVPDTA